MDMWRTYERIRHLAVDFAQEVRQATSVALNPTEFPRQMNKQMERVGKRLGVNWLFREQYPLAVGRADAVYSRLLLLYKTPGLLRGQLDHKHTHHAVQQLKDAILRLVQEQGHQRERFLGVAFDGYFFIFVRYQQGDWIIEAPMAVTAASSEQFLRLLFSLVSGRALIADNLVEDFGRQNGLAQQLIAALYRALQKHREDRPAWLFAQWKIFFGHPAGREAASGKLPHHSELHMVLKSMGLNPHQVDLSRFCFALHTYVAFLVENIARLVLEAYEGGRVEVPPLATTASLDGQGLRQQLTSWEQGDIYRQLGVKNFPEGNFFAWYLDAWNAELQEALRQVLGRLVHYNPFTLEEDPYSARDLFKKLYHCLLPRELRHDLGEFYTPDWLAERLLEHLDEPLFLMPKPGQRIPIGKKRLLDPACGSGTFLVLAARALKAHCRQARLDEADTLERILNSLAGLDRNPLAVRAAQVNLLLTIADLLPYRRRAVELPIYLADCILTPARKDFLGNPRLVLETVVGPLLLPWSVGNQTEIDRLRNLVQEDGTGQLALRGFIDRCLEEIPHFQADFPTQSLLQKWFERLQQLHRQGCHGLWAQVVQNALMPLGWEPFDYVVGNPPWINWEHLPQEYRYRTMPLWHQYGLFVHSGMDTILGKSKKDLSTLITYVAADRYLKPGGKLAFLIPQSVWKTSGAAQGFRRFQLGKDGQPLRLLRVEDLSQLQVFPGATTRTSIFVLQKAQTTRYPVPYIYWQKKIGAKGLHCDTSWKQVLHQTRRLHLKATPVDPEDPTSPWLTAQPKALQAIKKVLGKSDYRAYEGANSGGANAIYWLEKLAERPDGLWIVRNLTEGAKRHVEPIPVEIEPDLLYPLLRRRDIRRWHAHCSAYLLMTQDPQLRRGIDPQQLQTRWPKTWAYLKRHEPILRQRSAFQRYFTRKKNGTLIHTGPFYSMFGVGPYTFAPWKVVWARLGNRMEAAALSTAIPQETITFLPCSTQNEAYYLASLINSTPFQFAAYAYSQAGGKSFGTPSILEKIRLPRFDPHSLPHQHLENLSREAHRLAPAAYKGNEPAQKKLKVLEKQIDRLAAQLWNLTPEELREIRQSLNQLKGETSPKS